MYPSLLLLLLVIGLGAARGFGVGLAPNCGAGVVAQHGQHVVGGFSANRVGRDTDAVSVMMSASQFNRDGGANEHMDKRDDQREDDPVMSKVKQRDWRLFRAKLINQFASENGDSKLEWGDGNWAHELVHVEPGCLLLATEQIWDPPFRQSVVLVLSHDEHGSVGLVLNQPGPQRVSTLAGLKPDLAEVFGESLVFAGGPVGLGSMTVMHATEGLEGSESVLPGVYSGGFDSLVQRARHGLVVKDRVRFIHGHSAWTPGQLQRELDDNMWFVAAAAPELVTAGCDRPINPLWGQVLSLMGGRYQRVARRNGPFA